MGAAGAARGVQLYASSIVQCIVVDHTAISKFKNLLNLKEKYGGLTMYFVYKRWCINWFQEISYKMKPMIRTLSCFRKLFKQRQNALHLF